ncbi:helix-turn-helix domain-containing protein [Siccirubricoccus sp. G192]|uniref:helix-turn-helix domain-containing protein n=1 Tax=Siccirubricoccus sp. G192 TaxID=2849651 RepID=UPI001C2BF5C5|nr:helix-turn-helix domain-containing protein [Siccirubricoccus sp. G192]MBV1798921.1 helix-turn-helix domain-containing protein [Siccirubricoccus sp. G192]
MRAEGAHLSRITEPEDLVHAVPGVVFRATPLSAGPFEVSLTTIGLGDITLQAGHSTPHLAFAVARPGMAVVQLPLENVDTLVLNGRAVRPWTVGLHGGGAELLRANPRESGHANLVLPMDRAEELLWLPSGSTLVRPGAQDLLQTRPEAWNRMAGIVHAANEAVVSDSQAFNLEQAHRALRDALLDAAHDLIVGAGVGGNAVRSQNPRAWRRVITTADEYLRAHVARPIYTEELCSALGVSASGLAQAFRGTFGLSPHRFLKLRRLAMVRSLLRAREGQSPLVKSVALAHGFWHLGQFAHDYRALYGETPSDTLARAPGGDRGRGRPPRMRG